MADPYSSALLGVGYLPISAYDDPRKLLLACMTSRQHAKIVTLTAHYRFTGSTYYFIITKTTHVHPNLDEFTYI